MAENNERGPPLKDAIEQLMQRLAEERYSPLAVAAALSEAAVNMAAQSPNAENFEEFALAFDGYSQQLRELAHARAERGKH